VTIDVTVQSLDHVVRTVLLCKRGKPCEWISGYSEVDLRGHAAPVPEHVPSGATSNRGGYYDRRNDANMHALRFGNPRAASVRWQNYLAQQLPVLWVPGRYFQISAIRETLHGVDQDPNRAVWPEEWRVSG
jgi:hypothetical protein